MALIKVLEWVFTDSAISGVPRWSDDTKTPGEGLANCATGPTPALSHVSRLVSLSLSPFVGGRRRCTRHARRLRGAVGVVCRRRGGRAWDGAWSSNRSAAQATPTHPNDAKASPSPSAGRRDAKTMEGRTFFPAEVETMKVCKKWLLYSNGENSPGKTVNCWLML